MLDPPLHDGGSYPTPPTMDEYNPGLTQSQPSVLSCRTSTSQGSKRKAPMVDFMNSKFKKLTKKLDRFMDVMGMGNSRFEKISFTIERQVIAIEKRNDILVEQVGMMQHMTNFHYSESDIWETLADMNIYDENVME